MIGTADSHEIDAVGIVAAMRLAAIRAFDQLSQRGLEPDAVILDGSHNWLRSDSLFEEDDSRVLDRLQGHVHTKVKADRACASVAAASVMAKQHRDRRMIALDREYPQYQWSGNKGYASAGHIQALASVGPSPFHRLSWSLPGIVPTP